MLRIHDFISKCEFVQRIKHRHQRKQWAATLLGSVCRGFVARIQRPCSVTFPTLPRISSRPRFPTIIQNQLNCCFGRFTDLRRQQQQQRHAQICLEDQQICHFIKSKSISSTCKHRFCRECYGKLRLGSLVYHECCNKFRDCVSNITFGVLPSISFRL